MELHTERSALQEVTAGDLGFIFSTQRADNQLLVNDGETAVIGGLTVTEVTNSRSGIPLLSGLPIIGKLFGFSKTRGKPARPDYLGHAPDHRRRRLAAVTRQTYYEIGRARREPGSFVSIRRGQTSFQGPCRDTPIHHCRRIPWQGARRHRRGFAGWPAGHS